MSYLMVWIGYLIGGGAYQLFNQQSSVNFLDTAFAAASVLIVHWLINGRKA